MSTNKENYNQRLFKSGIRKWLHTSRFRFVSKALETIDLDSLKITELGCFDGKLLDFIPIKRIEKYQGYDADWEGGLSAAKKRDWPEKIEFTKCKDSNDFLPSKDFNLFISLETLEHIDEEILDAYLQKVSEQISKNGYLLITVPNEIGPVFLLKFFLKRILHGKGYTYTFQELFWQMLGITSKVERNEHKGFSYKELKILLDRYFSIESSKGLPFKFLPKILNFSVSFIYRPKKQS